MFNDIEWRKNDENCISNAEKVKNYAKRFRPGHWTFLGPSSEKRWYGDSQDGQWDRTGRATMFDQMEKTDGDESHLYAENIFVFESFHKPNRWELFQQAQLSDRFMRFIL